MMSRFGKGVVVVAVVSFLVMVVLTLFEVHSEPPLAVYAEPTVENFTIEVSALYNGSRRCGRGVIIENDGKTFILTSRMLFIDDHEEISVEVGLEGNWTVEGKLIETNKEFGLACVVAEPGWNAGCKINDLPNVPPWTEVEMRGPTLNTLGYISDDWVLVEGGITEDDTGSPVWMHGELVGIIVGLNIENRDQAIIVGIRAIREFANTIGDSI